MKTGQIISSSVPTLNSEDTIEHALDLMEREHFSELPLVTDDEYVALVRETELLENERPEQALSTVETSHFKPAIPASAHPFEAMRALSQMEVSVLPVVDSERKYVGCITRDTLLKYITDNSGINVPGGIVVLEVAFRDYTLVEIARICENEDVTILNLQVHPGAEGMLEITLKLNRSTLGPVVSSFERHNYKVLEHYGDENKDNDILDNYKLLMNYIFM